MKLEDLVLQLQKNRKVFEDIEIILFLQALEGIQANRTYENIPLLLTGFDDEADDPEMMYEIIHAVESYFQEIGSELYLKILFDSLVEVSEYGGIWMKLMIKRVLNSISCRNSAIYILKTCDLKTRDFLYTLLAEIKDENAVQFGTSVDHLQSELEEIRDFLEE